MNATGSFRAQILKLATQRLSEGTAEEGDAPNRASRRWAFELAARALRDTVHLEDAARIAGLALELTDEDEISYRTAEMYEIRARWLLDSGSGQGRQELAQAIAIHLAFGSTERARELSKYFMPEGRSRHDETPEHGSDAWDGDLKAA